MTAKEAWNSIMAGKKIRCVDWVKGAYIYYDKISFTIKDENCKRHSGMIFDRYFNDKQWELYEEDERRNTMNFEEARRELLDGKKVRCKDWVESAYVYFDKNNMLVYDNKGMVQGYGIYDKCGKKDWELYEEPKKLIKVFISQPMNGRCKCEITEERNKIKKLIEAKYSEGYQIEYLNEDVDLWGRPEEWTRIQHLGYSIMNMHDADVVVFAPDWIKAHGCCVEHEVAYRYDKKLYTCEEQPNGEYILY